MNKPIPEIGRCNYCGNTGWCNGYPCNHCDVYSLREAANVAGADQVTKEEEKCLCRLGAYHVNCPVHGTLDLPEASSESVETSRQNELLSWRVEDIGTPGVRDVWSGKKIICVDVPPDKAQRFCDAHNATTLPAPSDNVSAVKTDLGLPGGVRPAEHVLQEKLPDESGLWWWWNGDEDSEPIPVTISLSGGTEPPIYFANPGQWGWNRYQNVDEMGGWWCPCKTPSVGAHSSSTASGVSASPEKEGEVAQQLGNLLAVIHGDGGDYQSEHGTEKAITDAHIKLANMRMELEELSPDSSSPTIYNHEESKAILDLSERQGLSPKQVLRQALREYQTKVLGPVDLGPKAPPDSSSPATTVPASLEVPASIAGTDKEKAIRIEKAVGGSYENIGGRSFWIDAPVAREIARRVMNVCGK